MEKLHFLHVSDTHILRGYSGSMLAPLVRGLGESPVASLECAADYQRRTCPETDFIVISGDLVHEGGTEDYAFLKQLLEEQFAGISIYLCLGNHDRRAAFRAGFLGEEGDAPYYYARTHDGSGLRIIVLDSSHDNSGKGYVDKEQLDWLAGELKTKAPGGTLLVLHHPPHLPSGDPMTAAHSLINSEELSRVIEGSDIFAILSGHTHQENAAMFGSIPHYTADSTAFGVSISSEYMSMNDRLGLSRCTVLDGSLEVSHADFRRTPVTGFQTSIEALIKMMGASHA